MFSLRLTALAITSLLCPISWAQVEAVPQGLEQAFKHYISFAQDLTPLLKEVTDKTSADKTALSFKSRLEEIYLLSKELSKVQDLAPETLQLITKQYELPMREEWGKLYEQIIRLQHEQCFGSLAFAQQLQALCTILNQ